MMGQDRTGQDMRVPGGPSGRAGHGAGAAVLCGTEMKAAAPVPLCSEAASVPCPPDPFGVLGGSWGCFNTHQAATP